MSDVPLGVWLSGGLDSSSLVHYAAEASSSRLKTFSITFRGRSFDEANYVRQVAERYGTEHTELDLNPEQDLPGAIQELAYYCDEPNADSGALPVWFLSKLTKASATVALSGEGADELFGGYLMQRASLLARTARRLPPPVLRALLAIAQRWPVSNDKIGFEYKLKRFLEGCRMPAARAHVYWSGTFDDQEKRCSGSAGRCRRRSIPSCSELAAAGDDLQAYLWFDQKYFLPDNILTKVDHTSMAHAVEVRPPFLDHRIVEFANSLPGAPEDPRLPAKGDFAEPDARQTRLRRFSTERKSASTFPRTTGSADRCGLCSRKPWHSRPPNMATFFRSRRLKLMCELISTGAPTWAIICGD